MNASSVKSASSVKVDYQVDPPRFSVQNVDELQQGVDHLEKRGYAVFSDILTGDEVRNGIDLLWKHLEKIKVPCRIRRDHPETWNKDWPGSTEIGLFNDSGIGQSEFMWYLRGNPNVKKVFSQIWKSDELCVSFDGAGCYRDWHINPTWKTQGAWYHCDQNPFRKPERCSVQGFVALTDNDESTGGLVIVPDSHERFVDLQFIVDENRLWGDFVSMPSEIVTTIHPRLVKCKAGDLVVWDSRCVHCNTPTLVDRADEKPIAERELLRVVAYICMSPLELFHADGVRCESLEEFREIREDFVRMGVTCTHWPLELVTTSRLAEGQKGPLKLNAYQRSLIIGTDVKPEDGTAETVY